MLARLGSLALLQKEKPIRVIKFLFFAQSHQSLTDHDNGGPLRLELLNYLGAL